MSSRHFIIILYEKIIHGLSLSNVNKNVQRFSNSNDEGILCDLQYSNMCTADVGTYLQK